MATKYTAEQVKEWSEHLISYISVKDFGAAVGVSPRSLREAFLRCGLSSPGWYLNHAPQTLDESAPVATTDKSDNLDKPDFSGLARFCKRGARTVDDVANWLDVSPKRAQQHVAEAIAGGYALGITGGRVAFTVPDGAAEATRVAVEPADGETYRFAVASDIHFGSKHCRQDFLEDFCRHAYDRGCRLFLNPGDSLDGNYHFSVHERRAHGFDDQADELIRLLPQSPDAHWKMIDGNHDETLSKAGGFVAGRALVERAKSQGRNDMTFLGQRRATIALDSGHEYSPKVELWHPKQGRAYALSYRLQKRVESFQPGCKPDFLICGHTHSFAYICERGVHAICAGTFQGGGSPFGKALGSSIAIGGTIVSYQLTAGGTVRSAQVERVAYYEREDVRRVTL